MLPKLVRRLTIFSFWAESGLWLCSASRVTVYTELMIHILEEHFHQKAKVQVLRCLLLLADVVMVDSRCYSSRWFSSYVTGIISTVFRSGGTINPEITTLELVQAQQISHKFPYAREGYVYPSSAFYWRIIKIQVKPIPAREEKRAFLRRGKSTELGSLSLFFCSLPSKWLPKVETRGKDNKRCIEKIFSWPRFWAIHQLLTCSLI